MDLVSWLAGTEEAWVLVGSWLLTKNGFGQHVANEEAWV